MGVQVPFLSSSSPEIAIADTFRASFSRHHDHHQFLPSDLFVAVFRVPRLSVPLRVQHAGNGVQILQHGFTVGIPAFFHTDRSEVPRFFRSATISSFSTSPRFFAPSSGTWRTCRTRVLAFPRGMPCMLCMCHQFPRGTKIPRFTCHRLPRDMRVWRCVCGAFHWVWSWRAHSRGNCELAGNW